MTVDDLEALRKPLFAYVCRSCWNTADAEDLVQDVFIRCLRALRRGVVIEDLSAWVFTAARRLSIDRGTSRVSRARYMMPCGLTEEMASVIPDGSMPLDEQVFEQERATRMRQALAAMTPLQRRCIELRADGLMLREIAAVLDSSPQRVSEAIARAVPRLQRAAGVPVTPVHKAPSRLRKAA